MNSKDTAKRLQKALDKLVLTKSITLSDIKDIIWQEKSVSDFNRLAGLLLAAAKDEKQANEVVQVIQEAWNVFPHKALGGKSPAQVAEMYTQSNGEDIALPVVTTTGPKRKTIAEIFADSYPKTVEFGKIGRQEWGFEFPQLYHELTEKFYELQESEITTKEYVRELREILHRMPELFDVASELASLYVGNGEYRTAKAIYETSVKLAKSYIPSQFIPVKHHIIWAYLDNRPFLRLLADYAQFLEQTEKLSRVIPYYEELLLFNPNDNQGIRGLLVTRYLKTNQPDKAIELAEHYPKDITPELVMGKVLALIKLGRFERARTYLKKNEKYQKHVIAEILKTTHPLPDSIMEDQVTVGGEDEAWYFWQDQGALWQATQGAKDFIREVASNNRPESKSGNG
jgi:tetratricopeptide (TPR) repeat protein